MITYIRTYTYTHAHMHAYIHIHMHACTHTYIHAHTHMHAHIHTHTCMHTYIHICMHTYIHTHKYIQCLYIYTLTQSHAETFTHTHTLTYTHTNNAYTHIHSHRATPRRIVGARRGACSHTAYICIHTMHTLTQSHAMTHHGRTKRSLFAHSIHMHTHNAYTHTEPRQDASWAHEEVLVSTLSMLLYHNKVCPSYITHSGCARYRRFLFHVIFNRVQTIWVY